MVDKDTVRQGYDEIATIYGANRESRAAERTIVEQFLESLSPDAHVLDAGCGQGIPVLCRLTNSHSGVGVDLSSDQLQVAQTAAPDADLVQGDMTRLPVGDDTVDAVTAIHSCIHIPVDEHQQVIEEFARVLRPGGRVLMSDGPGEWRGRNPDWLESGVEMEWAIAGVDATRDHLADAGFSIDTRWTTDDELADEDSTWVFLSATHE